ncbi:hypothetical protein [Ligilactobacillus aviarius]|uniref:hypothetical protein n=1 Tax=Ligilactobacillus aviarius TaxID=1606 RepID=UPI0024B9A76F|nr:hypothetical protein [Ligilactobacillus aviarius]
MLTDVKISTKIIFDIELYEEKIILKFDGRKLNLVYEKGLPDTDEKMDFITFTNIWPEFIVSVLDKIM